MMKTMGYMDRGRCLRCGSTNQLTHHHVIPRALSRKVGASYWKLFASIKIDWDTFPAESLWKFQESAKRWESLPHYTQRLCFDCHEQVHREIKMLGKQIREAQCHKCNSQCDFFECEFWRQFDLGNLFVWFAPESVLGSPSSATYNSPLSLNKSAV